MDALAIGKRIRERREQLGWSQKELSDRLRAHDSGASGGISHISRMEGGKSGGLKAADLRALARVLDVADSWLVEGPNPDRRLAYEHSVAPYPTLERALTRLFAWMNTTTEAERLSFITLMERLGEAVDGKHRKVDLVVYYPPDVEGGAVGEAARAVVPGELALRHN